MLIEKNAQYYLKRTRAFAKEVEFDIPEELRANKEINVNELFPLTIACIADLSADIVRGKESNEQIKIHKNELYFASKFYDSYLNLNNIQHTEDSNYFNLIGAIAYYLCDQIGSSLVLIRNVNIETLNLSHSKLDILIYYLLKNELIIENSLKLNPHNNYYISKFIRQYNELMNSGILLDRNFLNEFRYSIYDTKNYRDIFLIDALLAIFILKSNRSIFHMLPKASNIPSEKLIEINGQEIEISASQQEIIKNNNLLGKEIIFAIRPEFFNCTATTNLFVTPTLIELLGSEKLVHFSFDDKKFCAKLPQEFEIRENQIVKLPFDIEKGFFFDINTEKRIR